MQLQYTREKPAFSTDRDDFFFLPSVFLFAVGWIIECGFPWVRRPGCSWNDLNDVRTPYFSDGIMMKRATFKLGRVIRGRATQSLGKGIGWSLVGLLSTETWSCEGKSELHKSQRKARGTADPCLLPDTVVKTIVGINKSSLSTNPALRVPGTSGAKKMCCHCECFPWMGGEEKEIQHLVLHLPAKYLVSTLRKPIVH